MGALQQALQTKQETAKIGMQFHINILICHLGSNCTSLSFIPDDDTSIFHWSVTVWDGSYAGPAGPGVEGFTFAPGTPASSQVEDASVASEDEEEEVREDENEVGIEKILEEKEMDT